MKATSLPFSMFSVVAAGVLVGATFHYSHYHFSYFRRFLDFGFGGLVEPKCETRSKEKPRCTDVILEALMQRLKPKP